MAQFHLGLTWISTEAHMAEFGRIRQRTSLLRAMFFGFRLPPDMPALKVGRHWVPVVHFSSGSLDVVNGGIRFQAQDPDTSLKQYRGVRSDIAFEITPDQIESVDRWQPETAFIRYYTIPFVRVRTSRPDWLKCFLVSAGGNGPSMSAIRAGNDALWEVLQSRTASPQ